MVVKKSATYTASSQRERVVVGAGVVFSSFFFFFCEIVPKNHRVHRRANYRIAIANTRERERENVVAGACAHLTAAGRQMIQNTGGNWFSVEGVVGGGGQ